MSNQVLAYTMFRLFMGLNMMLHGAVRLGENYPIFVAWAQGVFAESWLPEWLVTLEARLIPGVEIIIGVMLLLGFRTRIALIAAFALMATLVFGMNVVQDWELVSRHLVYVIAFYLLMYNLEHNEFSMDARR
jgi:thiosulfate dehydrogenase [quinone] large subunit